MYRFLDSKHRRKHTRESLRKLQKSIKYKSIKCRTKNSSFLKETSIDLLSTQPHGCAKRAMKSAIRLQEELWRRLICLWSGCRPARTTTGTRAVCSAAPGCRSAGRRNASSIRRSGRQQNNDARLCWRASRPQANTCEKQTHTRKWAD